jgi:methylase of polypeptide subunit release factors
MKSHELFDTKPVEALLKRHTEHTAPYWTDFLGKQLLLTPEVFNPSYTKVSGFLAKNIIVKPGDAVLDMFCGSGALGLVTAPQARKLVGVDISDQAITCSRENAIELGLEEIAEFRQGNLWEGVHPWELFDVIIANPPLLPAEPENLLEMAVADPDMKLTTQFIAGLPAHLTNEGCAFMAFSNACSVVVGDPIEFLATQAARARLQYSVVDEWDVGYEVYRIIKFYR